METREVLVDTSSILFGFANKRNVFESLGDSMPGYMPVISKGVVRELEKFSNSRTNRRPGAAAALAYIVNNSKASLGASMVRQDSLPRKMQPHRKRLGDSTPLKSDIHIDYSTEYVDKWIEKRSERTGGAVCTNDIALKRRLRNAGVVVVSIARSGRIR